MSERIEKIAFAVGWAAIALVLALVAARLVEARYPEGWDHPSHLAHTIALYDAGQAGADPAMSYLVEQLEPKWPPLLYVLGAFALKIQYNAWSLQILTWLIAAAFVAFFYTACRRFSSNSLASLAATLAMIANPLWLQMALSYNQEMILLTGLAAIFALFPRDPEGSSFHISLIAGLAAGIALLAKTVILPMVAVPLAVYLLSVSVRTMAKPGGFDKALNPAGFLAAMFMFPAYWYRTQTHGLFAQLYWDLGPHSAQEPWWYYIHTFFLEYGLGPFLVVAAIAVLSQVEKPKRLIALPLVGAALGLIFFQAIDTKRAWYLLAPTTLFLMAGSAWLSTGAKWVREKLTVGLILLYGAAALLVWFPSTAPLARIATLGTAGELIKPLARSTPLEDRIAEKVAQFVDPENIDKLRVLPSDVFDLSTFVKAMFFRIPECAAYEGWHVDFGVPETAGHLASGETLIAFEKPGSSNTTPSFEALALSAEWPPSSGRIPNVHLKAAIEHAADRFTLDRRIRIDDSLELTVYRSSNTQKKDSDA
jgi:hypothetical protein